VNARITYFGHICKILLKGHLSPMPLLLSQVPAYESKDGVLLFESNAIAYYRKFKKLYRESLIFISHIIRCTLKNALKIIISMDINTNR